jgi:Ferritin-like domain
MTKNCLLHVLNCRAIKNTVKGFPRPLLDISPGNFARIINSAMNRTLNPPFDPYANGLNYLLASYLIPYVGLTGYVGANSNLQSAQAKRVMINYSNRDYSYLFHSIYSRVIVNI